MLKITAVAGVGATIIVGLMTIFGSWYSVDQGERAVLLRFGAITKTTEPGLHWKTPFIDGVSKVSVRVDCIEWEAMETYSKDQQPAHVGVKICFRVTPDDASVKKIYTEYRNVRGYADAVIRPRALEGVKTIFGQYNAVTAIQERAKLNADIEAQMRSIDGPIILESVQIQNIAYSQAYEASVEARMQAQVEVEKVQQNLEREKIQAEMVVVKAQADAQRVRLAGEAEAAAIKARGDALRDNPRLVELVAAEKWDGKLPSTQVPGSAVPFMQIPMGQ